jgi:hypothetical protein
MNSLLSNCTLHFKATDIPVQYYNKLIYSSFSTFVHLEFLGILSKNRTAVPGQLYCRPKSENTQSATLCFVVSGILCW